MPADTLVKMNLHLEGEFQAQIEFGVGPGGLGIKDVEEEYFPGNMNREREKTGLRQSPGHMAS